MPTINTYFDKVFCINLKRRTDRWEHTAQECRRHNLVLERFDAYDGVLDANRQPNGQLGCAASHRALLEIISYTGWNRTLVLEDDFEFRFSNSQALFSDMIGEVPTDWDMLYLGGQYAEKPQGRISPRVIRAGRMLCVHAYGITKEFARAVAPYVGKGGGTDNAFADFSAHRKFYVLQPRLIMQMNGYSDLEQRVTNNSQPTTDGRHEAMV